VCNERVGLAVNTCDEVTLKVVFECRLSGRWEVKRAEVMDFKTSPMVAHGSTGPRLKSSGQRPI
jgi:hypothetical protein